MSNLDDAIKKAVAEQYPPSQPAPPAQVILIKAHKKSERQRWVEHYTLQLKSAGFTIARRQSDGEINLPEPINWDNVFLSEFIFHPTRKWRFDFAHPIKKLAVEIEGGVWRRGGGAHSHPTNIMRDIEKSNNATLLGWHLLRFTDKEIRSGDSIQMTLDFLKK